MFYAKRIMSVPTEADWGNYQSDLDLFAGHTNEEMQLHFYRYVIEYADELMDAKDSVSLLHAWF